MSKSKSKTWKVVAFLVTAAAVYGLIQAAGAIFAKTIPNVTVTTSADGLCSYNSTDGCGTWGPRYLIRVKHPNQAWLTADEDGWATWSLDDAYCAKHAPQAFQVARFYGTEVTVVKTKRIIAKSKR